MMSSQRVLEFDGLSRFAARSGASVPNWLAERFDSLDEDVATRKLIAAAVAAEQVLDLVDRGVTDFHFYTMNRADLVFAICHLLGLRPHDRVRYYAAFVLDPDGNRIEAVTFPSE